jgi:hypothetical protein
VTTWQAIALPVTHGHLKDSISVPSARHPFTCVLPDEGEFPRRAILQALNREFPGSVGLEREKLWYPYLPPLDEELRLAGERA